MIRVGRRVSVWWRLWVLMLGLFAGYGAAEAATPRVIRIGVAMAGPGGLPYCALSYICVAHVKGFIDKEFAADGTKVEWHFYTGAGPAVNEALAARQLDFAWQGDLPSIVARAMGLHTRLLMAAGGRWDYYVAVPADSPAKTLADLRGKTLAVFKGTNLQTVGTRILESEHIDPADIKTVNLDAPTAMAAIVAHQVDATLLSFWGFGLRDSGKIRFIYSTANHSPKLEAQAALLVTEEFAARNPDAVQRFVDAALRAARWASDEDKRREATEIYAKTGYPASFFNDELEGHSMKAENTPLFDGFALQQYKDVAAISLRLGLTRKAVDVDGWVDRAPLQKALVAQGLAHFWTYYNADGVAAVGE